MEARAFYGLTQMPFEKETRYKEMFRTYDVKNIIDRLNYLKNTRGIGVFTGGPGTGKTSTVKSFLDDLNPALYKVVYIHMSTISVIEFYRQIAYGLGLEPKNRKCDLFRQIQETISYLAVEKKCIPVIVLDEAQFLSNPILHDIKMLLNFNMDSRNNCILIFIGESGFNGILKRHVHDALRQRIVINYDMQGIGRDEASGYITYCMRQCGVTEPVFSQEAVEAAYSIGNGSIRKMNNILVKSLIQGASEDSRVINGEIVLKAHNEVELA